MHAAQSSVKKGETLIDTAVTLNSMRADAIVIRHGSSGAVQLIADKVGCPVLNAGDGTHEHPTQALLDALTIRRKMGRLQRLTVAICGDIAHSRVARSRGYCASVSRRNGRYGSNVVARHRPPRVSTLARLIAAATVS